MRTQRACMQCKAQDEWFALCCIRYSTTFLVPTYLLPDNTAGKATGHTRDHYSVFPPDSSSYIHVTLTLSLFEFFVTKVMVWSEVASNNTKANNSQFTCFAVIQISSLNYVYVYYCYCLQSTYICTCMSIATIFWCKLYNVVSRSALAMGMQYDE